MDPPPTPGEGVDPCGGAPPHGAVYKGTTGGIPGGRHPGCSYDGNPSRVGSLAEAITGDCLLGYRAIPRLPSGGRIFSPVCNGRGARDRPHPDPLPEGEGMNCLCGCCRTHRRWFLWRAITQGCGYNPRVTERRADFLARLINGRIILVVGARHASPLRFAGKDRYRVYPLPFTFGIEEAKDGRGTLQCAPTTPEVPSRGRIFLPVCNGRGVRDALTLTLSRREREFFYPCGSNDQTTGDSF
jgi:hypothetical protein